MANQEDVEVACPVCGKTVGADVSSCPYCGAEFEHGEGDAGPSQAGKPVSADDGEEVACPVCGVLVGLDVASCPKCGAEFEEEEIEEIIEVEEKRTVFEAEPEPAPARARSATQPRPRPAQKVRPKAAPRKEPVSGGLTASIMDLRVVGLALIILGIVGSQIALMIDWYWSWVPPIEDNLAMFVVIPVVLLVLGLVAFMVVKKAVAGGREMPDNMPGASLAVFLFGILALIVVVLWDPVNSALEDSQAAVAGGFAVALILGILFLFMGSRSAAKRKACD